MRAKQILGLLSGVAIGYAITAAAFIACALAITYTGMSEKSLPVFITVICVISVVVAGFDSARAASGRGWIWGLCAGLLYCFILLILGKALSKDFAFDLKTVMLSLLCITGGGLGGIIGINFKR